MWRRKETSPPSPSLPWCLNLQLNGTISESLLILACCVVKWRGCGGESNYRAEQGQKQMRGRTDGGWRRRRPERRTPLDTIQSEQSSVAVSTFSSASKCQAKFTHTHTHSWKHTALSDRLNAEPADKVFPRNLSEKRWCVLKKQIDARWIKTVRNTTRRANCTEAVTFTVNSDS